MLPQGMKLVCGNAISLNGVMPGSEERTHVTDEGFGDLRR